MLTGDSVVVLFVANTVFAQRILRATQPNFGWNFIVSKIFLAILISVPIIIIYNIVFLIFSFFTLNVRTLTIVHIFQLLGSLYVLFLAFLPLPVMGIAFAVRRLAPTRTVPVQKFGKGRFRKKIIILTIAAALLTTGAAIRFTSLVDVRPANRPGKSNSKAVLWITNFTFEIIVVALYAIARVDLLFYVPDGCHGPGDYSSRKKIPGWLERPSIRSMISEAKNPFSDTESIESTDGNEPVKIFQPLGSPVPIEEPMEVPVAAVAATAEAPKQILRQHRYTADITRIPKTIAGTSIYSGSDTEPPIPTPSERLPTRNIPPPLPSALLLPLDPPPRSPLRPPTSAMKFSPTSASANKYPATPGSVSGFPSTPMTIPTRLGSDDSNVEMIRMGDPIETEDSELIFYMMKVDKKPFGERFRLPSIPPLPPADGDPAYNYDDDVGQRGHSATIPKDLV